MTIQRLYKIFWLSKNGRTGLAVVFRVLCTPEVSIRFMTEWDHFWYCGSVILYPVFLTLTYTYPRKSSSNIPNFREVCPKIWEGGKGLTPRLCLKKVLLFALQYDRARFYDNAKPTRVLLASSFDSMFIHKNMFRTVTVF